MFLVLLLLVAYILGSLNAAVILFRLLGKGDPRTRFSGNAGTTNIYRQEGLPLAAAVFLLDVGRAALVAWLSLLLLPTNQQGVIVLGLILGNRFPVFHGFRGGKGVANFLGYTVVAAPLFAGLAAVSWLLVYGATRQPFMGSAFLVTTAALGLMDAADWANPSWYAVLATWLLILLSHAGNVRRWLQGD